MWVTAYTDASFKDGVGGWAIWLRSELGRVVLSGKCPETVTDNSLAEMYAIGKAIGTAKDTWSVTTGVQINTDHQGCITLLKRGDFSKPITSDLELLAWDIRAMVNNHRLRLHLKHVKGHGNGRDIRSYLNNKVDGLAGKHTGRY